MADPIFKIYDADSIDLSSTSTITIEPVIYDGPTITEQVITLRPGWNFIGTIIDLDTLDSSSSGGGSKNVLDILSSIQPDNVDYDDESPDNTYIILAKDYNGSTYLPEFDFNGIGDFPQHTGLHIRTIGTDNMQFTLKGNEIAYDNSGTPQNISFVVPQGWSFITNPFSIDIDVESFFANINNYGTTTNNLIIVKEIDGNVYLPEFNYNGIGSISSGETVQVKTENQVSNFFLNISQFNGGVAPTDSSINVEDVESNIYDDSVIQSETNYSIIIKNQGISDLLNSMNEPIQFSILKQEVLQSSEIYTLESLSFLFNNPASNVIYIYNELELFVSDVEKGSVTGTISSSLGFDKELLSKVKELLSEYDQKINSVTQDFKIVFKNPSGDIISSTINFNSNIDVKKNISVTIGYTAVYIVSLFLVDNFTNIELQLDTNPSNIESGVNATTTINTLSLANGVTYGIDIKSPAGSVNQYL